MESDEVRTSTRTYMEWRVAWGTGEVDVFDTRSQARDFVRQIKRADEEAAHQIQCRTQVVVTTTTPWVVA